MSNRADKALLWAVAIFLSTSPERERLAAAAEEWMTTPGTPAQGYMHRLAMAAQKSATATDAQLRLAKESLKEIFDLACRETPGMMKPNTTDAVNFDWQRRADTGID